jgi:hypothetical protein
MDASKWEPQHFQVGQFVVDTTHPKWGTGEVLDAQLIGELRLLDIAVYQLKPRSPGQRLRVRFADGRTRTIITAKTPLKPASEDTTPTI